MIKFLCLNEKEFSKFINNGEGFIFDTNMNNVYDKILIVLKNKIELNAQQNKNTFFEFIIKTKDSSQIEAIILEKLGFLPSINHKKMHHSERIQIAKNDNGI